MRGTIALANGRRGRYAVLTEDGDYTLFELLESVDLAVGEPVTGDFNAVAGETYESERHGKLSVFAENYHCTLSFAERWVAGN